MKRFLKGFVFAKNGFIQAIKEERNLRLHLVTGFYVLLFSLFYSLSKVESLLLICVISGVIALELINSAIERAVDKPLTQHHYNTAGKAKDMAAAGVLVFSIASAVCGVILFWDINVFQKMFIFFTNRPALLVLLILSAILSYFWAFKSRKEDN